MNQLNTATAGTIDIGRVAYEALTRDRAKVSPNLHQAAWESLEPGDKGIWRSVAATVIAYYLGAEPMLALHEAARQSDRCIALCRQLNDASMRDVPDWIRMRAVLALTGCGQVEDFVPVLALTVNNTVTLSDDVEKVSNKGIQQSLDNIARGVA